MKVLFIGGTGIISTACSQLALASNIDLYLLNRSQHPSDFPRAHCLTADINAPASVASALGDHTFDAVVNFIAYTPADVTRDIALFQNRTAQYVFISSASVYQRPAPHYLITESTPLANPFWQYSRDKIACEELLLAAFRNAAFPVTIIRPSLTFGNTIIPLAIGSWNHPWTLVDRMTKNLPLIVHGDGASLWQITHNSDFAKGLVGLLHHPQARGEAFHITTDEVLTWNQIYTTLADLLHVTPHLVHIASDWLCAHKPALTGSLLGDKSSSVILDNAKIKRFVPSFRATTSFQQGLAQTLAYLHDPARQSIDENFNAWTTDTIAAYQK